MAVLFNQHWDVAPGKHDAYTDFVMMHYIPTLGRLGINLVGGYYVTIGQGPRIIAVGLAESLLDLEKALQSDEYNDMTNGLMAHVTNYHSKIMVPTGRVQMNGYKVQTGIWKFNQYWNILPGMEEAYTEFVKTDHIPTLGKLGIRVTAGWRVIVGSGPYIVSEGSAPSLVDIARGIDSDEFRRVTHKLKSTFVTDYHSRVLAPTGRIDVPYFMQEMMKGF